MTDKKILYLGVRGLAPSILARHEDALGEKVGWNCIARLETPMKQLFTEIKGYYFCERYAILGPEKMADELIDTVKKFNPDYVIWLSMNYEISPETFDELRKTRAVAIGWFFDDEVRFNNFSKYYAPHLDYIFTTDSLAVEKYREMELFAEHLLVTSTPEVFVNKNLEKEYDAVFIGRKFGDRGEQALELMKRGISIETWGEGWKNGYISFDNMIDVYNKTKISLCFTKSYGANTRPQLKDKIFDIISCGGFLLCEYMPEIEDYFTPDKEIACFRDIDELEEKIHYYLAHDEERAKVINAGRKRFLENYTQTKLFAGAFSRIDDLYESLKTRKTKSTVNSWSKEALELATNKHICWSKALMEEAFPRRRIEEEMEQALAYASQNKHVPGIEKNLQVTYKTETCRASLEQNYRNFLKRFARIKKAMISVFEEMVSCNVKNYAVFGAGKHTIMLLQTRIFPRPPAFIIDENPKEQDLMGVPVVRPETVSEHDIRGIIVSSDTFEDALCERARQLFSDKIYVWRLYDEPRLVQGSKDQAAKAELPDLDSRPIRENWSAERLVRESLDFFGDLKKGCFYSYSYSQKEPLLYCLIYKLLLDALCGRSIQENEKKQYIEVMMSHYCADGLFRDSALESEIAENEDWWGWRHLTCHALPCLRYLGFSLDKPFSCCLPLLGSGNAGTWLESELGKHKNRYPSIDSSWAYFSNKVMNYGIMLQYMRDFQENKAAGNAMEELLDSLDSHINAQSGLYELCPDNKKTLSNAVQAGYHFWLLYFYDNRPLKYPKLLIDRIIETQNPLGGFSASFNSSACEDIDSIDPLCRLYFMTDYRREDIKKALEMSLKNVLNNWADSGGFYFRKNEPFQYGHELMSSGGTEGGAFPTWFRMQSLALLSKALKHPAIDYNWNFVDCPGMTFWRKRKGGRQ